MTNFMMSAIVLLLCHNVNVSQFIFESWCATQERPQPTYLWCAARERVTQVCGLRNVPVQSLRATTSTVLVLAQDPRHGRLSQSHRAACFSSRNALLFQLEYTTLIQKL